MDARKDEQMKTKYFGIMRVYCDAFYLFYGTSALEIAWVRGYRKLYFTIRDKDWLTKEANEEDGMLDEKWSLLLVIHKQ
jgi:hypothetical protein